MRYLTKKEIIFLNKNNISTFGGNFMPPHNFLHETYLDYLVEIVDADLFGQPMYATIFTTKLLFIYSILFQIIFLQTVTSELVLKLHYYF